MDCLLDQGGGDGFDGSALGGGLAREFCLDFGTDVEGDGHRRTSGPKIAITLGLLRVGA